VARKTGRRPGNPDTRAAILLAAREAFGESGFDGASIRAIATSAGVDPALVHHYFGTKEQLFMEAVQVPIDPRDFVPEILSGDHGDIGVRLVRVFLRVWDSPASAAAAALMRSAMNNDWTLRLLREFLVTQILRRLVNHLGHEPTEGALRASLVASQMAGLAMVRYIVRVEPLASAPPDVVVAAIAPTVQRYLTGDIAG